MERIVAEKTFTRGIAVGHAFVVQPVNLTCEEYSITQKDIPQEVERFEAAVKKAYADLSELAVNNAIFEGHLAIVQDYTFADSVKSRIQEFKNAQTAVSETVAEIKSTFENVDDVYIRERATDIVDVGNRLISILQNKSLNVFASLQEGTIIIADDIMPSDLAQIDFSKVQGFITESGGITSHVCIMAHNMGIPALVGVKGILSKIISGKLILMNAGSGEILIEPDMQITKKMLAMKETEECQSARLKEKAVLPAVTIDQHKVKVYANVGGLEDVEQALKLHVDGIGLFRSEFIFMENDHFPTEEEQFALYRQAVSRFNHEIIIRTLDIGADKKLKYYSIPHEENPFLGWRAIRISLDMKDMFKAQLRALLRASAFGPIKIMIPMVISCEELEQVKALIEVCKSELKEENIMFDSSLPIGVMIETPAAVLCADTLARQADFFSIGTNDLTQYILAVDRGNEVINHLYNSFHPAVIRAISSVIKAGHCAGIEVGLCGEFASDPNATEILLGLGLDEFSMASGDTPLIKEKIRNLDYSVAVQKAERLLGYSTTSEIIKDIILN